jgi:hypothetical protein
VQASNVQFPNAGGLQTKLPQLPSNANIATNLTVDRQTGGWSTRVGYEKFDPDLTTGYSPWTSTGPVTSLHVNQGLSNGARQMIMYEADGGLHLAYDIAGLLIVRTVASNRHQPQPTEAGAWFTDTGYGVIITNGVDRPLLVDPWPLGTSSESATSVTRTARPFGFTSPPAAPQPHKIIQMPPSPPASSNSTGGGAVTLWATTNADSMPDSGAWGMGFAGNTGVVPDNTSLYSWAVSFVSETGSESPLSTVGTAEWTLSAGAQGFRHCAAVAIPLGPPGTVARKLYRTNNYSSDTVAYTPGDNTLYYLDTVRNNIDELYFDAIRQPPGAQGGVAPTSALPAPRARFSAMFAGCLWLDGGVTDSTTMYFSKPGLIEQFEAPDYIQLPGTGGGVTALHGSYTNLIVFRENSIDVVRGDYTNGFKVTTISMGITCRAPHSIADVPGLGTVFLAQDGVYVLTGGLEGGATINVINLTSGMDAVTRRITSDCTPRAQGVFSTKLREYHVYFPVDGSDRPNLGLVLHLDLLEQGGGLSPWSLREDFPVGAMDVLHDGTVVFGHNTGSEASGNNPETGLFVLSHKRALGVTYEEDVCVLAGPPTSTYRSAWYNFGSARDKTRPSRVILNILTTGSAVIGLKWLKDFDSTVTSEAQYIAQPPDSAKLPVFDEAIIGTDRLRDMRLVPIAVDCAVQSASWFCFEVETTDDIVLVGFEYEFSSVGTTTRPGKTR